MKYQIPIIFFFFHISYLIWREIFYKNACSWTRNRDLETLHYGCWTVQHTDNLVLENNLDQNFEKKRQTIFNFSVYHTTQDQGYEEYMTKYFYLSTFTGDSWWLVHQSMNFLDLLKSNPSPHSFPYPIKQIYS